jgi:hypothetical protein
VKDPPTKAEMKVKTTTIRPTIKIGCFGNSILLLFKKDARRRTRDTITPREMSILLLKGKEMNGDGMKKNGEIKTQRARIMYDNCSKEKSLLKKDFFTWVSSIAMKLNVKYTLNYIQLLVSHQPPYLLL